LRPADATRACDHGEHHEGSESCGYAGVDVGKDKLDFGPVGQKENQETTGKPRITQRDPQRPEAVEGYQPKLIVVEASGGYEMAIVMALTAAGLVVAMVNPRQPRKFAEAIGKLPRRTESMRDVGAFRPGDQTDSPRITGCRKAGIFSTFDAATSHGDLHHGREEPAETGAS